VTRSNNNTFPRKFLATWVNTSRKNGAPQLICNNNFAVTIDLLLKKSKPLSSIQAPLKEWILLTKDEADWKSHIDTYFESCRNIKDEAEDNNNSDWEDNEEAQGVLYPMNRDTDECLSYPLSTCP
jgi:hypothetical protein